MCLPILVHLAVFSVKTKFIWIIIYISIILFINIKNWPVLAIGIFSILIYISFIIHHLNYQNVENGKYIIEGVVSKATNSYFIISNNNHNILVFTNLFVSPMKVIPGATVNVSGFLTTDIKQLNYDNNFFISNSITYLLNKPYVEKIVYPTRSINLMIQCYGDNFIYFSRYWKTIVFGFINDKIASSKVMLINVPHLLAISGLHFDILFFVIGIFFKPITKKFTKFNYVIWFIMFWYIALLSNYISGIRSLIMQITKTQKRVRSYQFKYLDGWLISLFVVFFINFNSIFSYTFIFSFSSSLLILVLNRVVKFKRTWVKNLLILGLIFLFNLPIVLKINKYFNLFAIIFGILLTPIFELIYIISIMCFWSVDFLNSLYYAFDIFLDFLIRISIIIPISLQIPWTIIGLNFALWFYGIFIYCLCKIKKLGLA